MKPTILVLVALCSSVLYAEKHEFSRYQTILDRMPFGQPPPGFDPTRSPDEVSKNDYAAEAPPLSEQQAEIQKNIQFSAINLDEDGTVMVGFVDKSDPKAAKTYYMAVGEERGGWLVKEADAIAKTMSISKDGVEVSLTLGENSGGGGTNAAKNAAGRNMAAARSNGLLGQGGSTFKTAQPTSFKGRRAQREEEQRRAVEAAREKEAAREAELAARKELDELREADRQREREEQRAQLNSIREELARVREEKRLREEENERIEAENDAIRAEENQ